MSIDRHVRVQNTLVYYHNTSVCRDTDLTRQLCVLAGRIVRYTSVCRYKYGREDRVTRLYVNRCRGRYKGVTNGSSDDVILHKKHPATDTDVCFVI